MRFEPTLPRKLESWPEKAREITKMNPRRLAQFKGVLKTKH